MTDDILQALHELMGPGLPGLSLVDSGMETFVEGRYGRVHLHFDFDGAAESIRVYFVVPPPPAAGPDFLIWCLSMNRLYWDVKFGLDAQGMLLIHADVDLDHSDLTVTARVLQGRVDAMGELLNEDLVPYLIENKLGTPAQIDRWKAFTAPRP